ncbi:MAG: ribonuclease HII [Thermoplasmata archaeon]
MKCGCDEAGRGPVIGPMVIAVVCGDEERFLELGVRDSKMLSQQRREALFKRIYEVAESVEYRIVSEEEIDTAVSENKLNVLEAKIISQMIREGGDYVIDCPDVNEQRFAALLVSLTGNRNVKAEHKADVKYPLVSAASIVAKVLREREVAKIRDEIGDFGSGYPSDRRTIEFLKSYYRQFRHLPPHTRKSWKTVNSITTTLDFY